LIIQIEDERYEDKVLLGIFMSRRSRLGASSLPCL